MNRLHFAAPVLICMIVSGGFSQPPGPPEGFDGFITGRVFDAEYEEPIEYANIVIYRQKDSLQVTGTITYPDGSFRVTEVPLGTYYVEVSFIGCHDKRFDNVRVTPSAPLVNLGNIFLEEAILQVEGTEAVAERAPLSYQIDKKVVNVSRQPTAASGTAVDVLENVPSVNVDIEGNVSLRGSENFTVLIDGRPTILEPSQVLQQIPASTIESIEIITNPSAKYDPDGIAGIINVISKKKSLRGISGVANMNIGLDDRYGGDVLFSYRTGNYNLYFGADYNHRYFGGTERTENINYHPDTTTYVFSQGKSDRTMSPYGLRGGIDASLGMNDKLSLGGRLGYRNMQSNEELNYEEWSDPGGDSTSYLNINEGEHIHDYYSLFLDYQHRFSKKDHTISAQTTYSKRKGEEESTSALLTPDSVMASGQTQIERGPGTRLRFKLDYTQPFGDTRKIETGYHARFERTEDINEIWEYDSITQTMVFQPEYSHTTLYNRDIHSIYGMYAGEWDALGYQLGLRGEYTNRIIELVDENQLATIDRLDYFPTAHFSYKFSSGQQIMTSYTRRIERPRPWYLEPFITWLDAYNVRMGNPALKPEYIDSYELGFQTFFGKSLFSTELYYRVTHNRVERISSTYDENVIMHTIENVGTDYALGAEFMLDLKFLKWWNVTCMANLYDYRIRSNLYGQDVSKEDFNWSTRISNEIRLLKSTTLQINTRYHSPSISSQGEREAFFLTDASLKQTFFDKALAITLQVRDVFSTGKREHTYTGEDFSYYTQRTRKSPMIMLNISFNFNNYKSERRPDENAEEFEGMEEL